MNRQQQYDYVRELIGNVEGSILEKLDRIPEDWDGHELRVYIADQFSESAAMSIIKREVRSRRAREYRNTVLVNNL